jgi:diguanylate cyclase (GGDEF)-like protein
MEVSNENKCEADTIANKIIEALSTDIIFNEKPIKVSCSIGISCFPDDATTVEELLRNADLAMYEAKKQGKSTYSYHSK